MMINYKNIVINFKFIGRYYSSALYITGDKAQKTFVVLTPVIDFEKQLTNKNALVTNCSARGLNISIDDIIKRWIFFHDVLKRKTVLELKRQEIGEKIAKSLKASNVDPLEIDKYKLHAKLVKEDLNNLKNEYYDIEGTTMINILGLPNVLHNKTPLKKNQIVWTYLQQSYNTSLNNIDIGISHNYIKYLDPFTCYLKSDAALLELSILNYFRRVLLKLDYLQWSNPNFCRAIISEGCKEVCRSDDSNFAIEEQEHDKDNLNKLYLCGSGSLSSFMAYFARHALHLTSLPMKYFSLGKLYQPASDVLTPSLFSLSQQTVVNIFMANLEDDPVNVDGLIKQISSIYNALGFHYRIVILPANKIEKAESLRISIQMFSNFKKDYVEVGNVSFYDSYISKRLLFTYSFNKQKKYPIVIAGSLINFHNFLGCVMENTVSDNLPLAVHIKEKVVELNNVQ